MEKGKPCNCVTKFSVRQKVLTSGLFLVSLLCSIWYLGLTFEDYNRYELYTINALGEASVAYKLDKKTGAVTALYNLMEFPVEKFSESGPSAQWSWPQRSEANHLLDYGD